MIDEAHDVEVLEDGGYAICGTGSLDGQGTRMILIVTDKYGNLKGGFPKYFTEEGLESGANTVVPIRGGQGGFLLAGYVERPVELGSEVMQKDIFLVKASTSGDENWAKSYGSVGDEVILHATNRITSGFMLAGFQVNDGKSDILIMGVEEEGDSTKLGLNYNNPFAENGRASYLLNTGDRYLCVCTYDKIGGAGGTDILVLNFDDELSPLDKNLTGDSEEYGTCIIEDGDDQYLVLGNRVQAGITEMVVHRIETNGLLITKSEQVATIPASNTDLIGERFLKTDDGRYAIVGTRSAGAAQDIFLQFLGSDHAASGRIIFGGAGNQSGADIALPGEGGIVLLGTSNFEENSMISMIKTSDTGDL